VAESWRYEDTQRREGAVAAALLAAALWFAAASGAVHSPAGELGRARRAALALGLPVLLCVDLWLVTVLNMGINPG
jgi:hypothetical protein